MFFRGEEVGGGWLALGCSTMVGQRGVTMSWYWWGTLAKLLSSGVLMLDGPPGVLRWN